MWNRLLFSIGADLTIPGVAVVDFGKKKKVSRRDEAVTEDMCASPCCQSDGLYSYHQLLARCVFKKPDLKFIPNPVVFKSGRGLGKTVFGNFLETAHRFHQQPQHLLRFFRIRLQTNCKVQFSEQLCIHGNFTQRQIEDILKAYVAQYVMCRVCRSWDTKLQKQHRLTMIVCRQCNYFGHAHYLPWAMIPHLPRDLLLVIKRHSLLHPHTWA